MNRRDGVRLSKFAALVLRHQPQRHGLAPDGEGWVPLPEFLRAARARPHWADLAEADVREMAASYGGGRYEIVGERIRAIYGHSLSERIDKRPEVPPELLYHGTAPASADAILRNGLKPMRRQYVHLSPDIETAQRIGSRKDRRPVILLVLAEAAHGAGVSFYRGNDSVWLADAIPAEFCSRIEEND